jgi:hypothetical protein
VVGDHILYVTRFRTYKILDHPKTKTQKGRGPRKINRCRKVIMEVNFKTKRFFIALFESFPSMVCDSAGQK